MNLSGRDSLILYLYYREGWSFRRIANALHIPLSSLHGLHNDIIDQVVARLPGELVNAYPLVEGLFTAWADAEQHQTPPIVALRQEQLAQALDDRLDARASELEALSECMGANCSPPHKRSKGAAWTHWEICYLNATGRTSVPSSAYNCKVCGRYARD